MGDDPSIVAGRKCLKCDDLAHYYSSNPKQAVYCRSCFFQMVLHKFSYVLGNNRVFRDGKKKEVLIFYRLKNVADEYLIETVRQESSGARPHLPAQPQVLVILEAVKDQELRAEYNEYKKKELNLATTWTWRYVHLSDVLRDNFEFLDDSLAVDDEKVKIVKYLFHKSSVKSDRMELKRLLVDLLIYRITQKLDMDKVMVGDSLDVIAQNAFNALCFGRGASMAQLSAAVDTRYPGLSIIRPLREVYQVDVELVMKLKQPLDERIQEMSVNQVEIKKKAALQDYNLHELTRLQKSGFASTLTNVIQTAVKVKAPFNPESVNTCCLCFDKTENGDGYCGSCCRLLEAIPDFPNQLKESFRCLV